MHVSKYTQLCVEAARDFFLLKFPLVEVASVMLLA